MDRYTFNRERNFSVNQNLFSPHKNHNGKPTLDRDDPIDNHVDFNVKDINTTETVFQTRPNNPKTIHSSSSHSSSSKSLRVLCDSEGDPIYLVIEPSLSKSLSLLRKRLHVEDVDSGTVQYVLRKRGHSPFSTFATKRRGSHHNKLEIDVWHGTSEESDPFLIVTGDLPGRNYDFVINGQRVGKVSADLFNMGSMFAAQRRYGVQVGPGCDVALFILLAGVVDDMCSGGGNGLKSKRGRVRHQYEVDENSLSLQQTDFMSTYVGLPSDANHHNSGEKNKKKEEEEMEKDENNGAQSNENETKILYDETTQVDDNVNRSGNDNDKDENEDEQEREKDEAPIVKHLDASSSTKFDDDCNSLADQFEKNLTKM